MAREPQRVARSSSGASGDNAPADPPPDCALCPRLVAYRADNRAAEPGWFNGAVPSFGDPDARLIVVGLAPGRGGANATGRPFTGDGAGEALYPALLAAGLARGSYGARADDGLTLEDCLITNAVRCAPPANKPTGSEMAACRPFLASRLLGSGRARVIVALGRIAHDNSLAALGIRPKDHPFAHAAEHDLGSLRLIDSYHCSRYNLNTRRLTQPMLDAVFVRARALAQAAPPTPA